MPKIKRSTSNRKRKQYQQNQAAANSATKHVETLACCVWRRQKVLQANVSLPEKRKACVLAYVLKGSSRCSRHGIPNPLCSCPHKQVQSTTNSKRIVCLYTFWTLEHHLGPNFPIPDALMQLSKDHLESTCGDGLQISTGRSKKRGSKAVCINPNHYTIRPRFSTLSYKDLLEAILVNGLMCLTEVEGFELLDEILMKDVDVDEKMRILRETFVIQDMEKKAGLSMQGPAKRRRVSGDDRNDDHRDYQREDQGDDQSDDQGNDQGDDHNEDQSDDQSDDQGDDRNDHGNTSLIVEGAEDTGSAAFKIHKEVETEPRASHCEMREDRGDGFAPRPEATVSPQAAGGLANPFNDIFEPIEVALGYDLALLPDCMPFPELGHSCANQV